MGSCCNTRPLFSKCKDQDHLKELIKEERKTYDYKFNYLNTSLETDIIEITSHGKNKEYTSNQVKSSDDLTLRVLQLFLEGLDEVESKLNENKYQQLKQLGVLLEKLFDHANDREDYEIISIKESIKEWFRNNKK